MAVNAGLLEFCRSALYILKLGLFHDPGAFRAACALKAPGSGKSNT
jgi:hypothetical protein